MTEDKKFKQRVRARMKKTGERYAVARHHVLKEAGVERTIRGTLRGSTALRGAWGWLSEHPHDRWGTGPNGVGRRAFGWEPPRDATPIDGSGRFELPASAEHRTLLVGAIGHESQALDLRGSHGSLQIALTEVPVAEISLEVHDPQGEPLANAEVELLLERGGRKDRPLPLTLDASGHARHELEPGEFRVRAQLANDETRYSAWETRTLAPGTNPRAALEITDLSTRPGVAVQVVDREGLPVPGARVGACGQARARLLGQELWEIVPPARGSQVRPQLVEADDAGRVLLRGLDPGAWLFAARSGQRGGRSQIVTLADRGLTEVRVVLDEQITTAHLRVHLRGLEGTQLDGVVEFVVHTAAGGTLQRHVGPGEFPYPDWLGTLAPDGSCTLWDLPPGRAKVELLGKNTLPGPRVEAEVDLVAGETALLELEPTRGTRIHGRVLTAAGVPVRGEIVAVLDPREGTVESKAELDANGGFELQVDPTRHYELRLRRARGVTDYVFMKGTLPTEDPLELSLPPGPILRVLDAEGQPCAHASVSGRQTEAWPESRFSATTDEEGRVSFPGLAAPVPKLHVHASGHAQLDLDEVILPAEVRLRPRLPAQRNLVSGRVLDEAGHPLENVAVSTGGPTVFTGADGRFALTVLTEGSVLIARRLDRATTWASLELGRGESHSLDVELKRGVAVGGRVSGPDTSTHAPTHPLRIAARCGERRESVTARRDRRFDLGRLGAGVWTIGVYKRGKPLSAPREVVVREGQEAIELELRLGLPEPG